MAAFEDTDFQKMSEIRARVDSIVAEHDTAQGLKAWYRQLCKRPCFHDEYLQSYNTPTVTLVDTGGQGVEEITETGLVVDGVHYEVDCIIYASGFEVGTEHTHRAGFDIVGRGGEKLSEHWSEGMRTLHGMHVHGFPNAFQVQLAQGANLISNVPHNFTEAARTITAIVRHALDSGATEVEAKQEAEDAWVECCWPRTRRCCSATASAPPATTTTRANRSARWHGSRWATRAAPGPSSSSSSGGDRRPPKRASSRAWSSGSLPGPAILGRPCPVRLVA